MAWDVDIPMDSRKSAEKLLGVGAEMETYL